MDANDVLQDYEDLEKEDIKACMLFASKLSHVKSIYKLAS